MQKFSGRLTASSTYTNSSKYSPSRAQLDTVADSHGAGGWKPSATESSPWIQVDFGEELEMAGVILTGRADAPEWVTSYRVQISDENCQKFDYVMNVVNKMVSIQGECLIGG